ncbi:MAG: hypothetical protein ACKOFD_08005, partial [Actinomycetota bacterium]
EQVDDEVTAIEPFWDGKFVALGGNFDSIGGVATPGVSVIDEVHGRIDDSFRSGSGPNVEVNDVAFDSVTESL